MRRPAVICVMTVCSALWTACGPSDEDEASYETKADYSGAREGSIIADGEPRLDNRRPAFGTFAFATKGEGDTIKLLAFQGRQEPRGDLLVLELDAGAEGVLDFDRGCDGAGCASGWMLFDVDVKHVLDTQAAVADAEAAFVFVSGSVTPEAMEAGAISGGFEGAAEDPDDSALALTVSGGSYDAGVLGSDVVGDHWSLFFPGDGHTWIYQGYDESDAEADAFSVAYSFGHHFVPELDRNVIYRQMSTATDAAQGSPDPYVWVPSDAMDAWGYGQSGALEEVGYVVQSQAGFVAYEEPGVVLPAARPAVGDTWGEVVDERPVAGGQDVEDVTTRRRLEAEGVLVEAPFGSFSDCYQVAVEEIAPSGDAVQRYEYWSPSVGEEHGGGLVAVHLFPDDAIARWIRLARITDEMSWDVPFQVQE
ncbi:MAG: hypothetical protein ACOC0J_01575 [Myxococcota bacterium]